MMKILVGYYSRTGFTGAIAREIATACNADLEPIRDIRRRSNGVSYVRSALEAALHMDIPIRRMKLAPDNYDLVVIGTPIWCWNVPAPVRSYIRSHRHQFKRVAFFCTYGGSGQNKVLQNLEDLCGQAAIAKLALRDTEITGDKYHDQVADFTARINGSDNLRQMASQEKTAFSPSPTTRHG